MAFHYSPKNPTSGLMLALDAANPKNTFVSGWDDLSGNNNPVPVSTGAPTFNSDAKGNFDFDGSDDRFLITGTGWSFANWTIITVVRPQSNAGNYRCWFSASGNNGTDYNTGVNWDMSGNSSDTYRIQNVEISRSYGGYYERDIMTSNFSFNTWVWQALTCSADGNQVQMFINGVREYNKTDYGGTITYFDKIAIGDRYYDSTDAFRGPVFDGNVALTFLYNRVLSQNELENSFNSLKSRFGL